MRRRSRRFWLVAALSSVLAGSALAGVATAEPIGYLADEITDPAGALGEREGEVRAALDRLAADTAYQLFVVFVADFDGLGAQEWADGTALASDLGRDDVLLAVAVEDRGYWLSVDDRIALTDAQLDAVLAGDVEPALRAGDWAGAAVGAAEGLRAAAVDADNGADNGAGSSGSGGAGWALLVVAGVGVVGLAAWQRSGRRSRGERTVAPERLTAAELDTRATRALVAADDAVKSAEEEVGFAQAQFGDAAAAPLAAALTAARQAVTEGFARRRDVESAEDEATRRRLATEILQLAEQAEAGLTTELAAIDELRDLHAGAPEALAALERQITATGDRLPAATAALTALAAAYPADALASVTGNVDQATALLSSARSFAADADARLAADRGAAVGLLRAGQEATAQAGRLLDAVDRAGTDLDQAASRIAAGVASLSADVADADRLAPHDAAVQGAAHEARAALAQAAEPGGDPLAALSRLTTAEAAIDAALGPARDAEDRHARARAQLDQVLPVATARLRAVADFIATRKGAVGAEARTRLAEAQGHLENATRLAATDPATALVAVQHAEHHLTQTHQLAQADVHRWGGGPGARSGGPDLTSMLLGGILFGGGGRRSGSSWGGGRSGSSWGGSRGSRGGGFRGSRGGGSRGGGSRGSRGGGGRF